MSGIPDLPGNDSQKYSMAESRAGVIVLQREGYLAIHYQTSPPGVTISFHRYPSHYSFPS